jgi:hypothetical protein
VRGSPVIALSLGGTRRRGDLGHGVHRNSLEISSLRSTVTRKPARDPVGFWGFRGQISLLRRGDSVRCDDAAAERLAQPSLILLALCISFRDGDIRTRAEGALVALCPLFDSPRPWAGEQF